MIPALPTLREDFVVSLYAREIIRSLLWLFTLCYNTTFSVLAYGQDRRSSRMTEI